MTEYNASLAMQACPASERHIPQLAHIMSQVYELTSDIAAEFLQEFSAAPSNAMVLVQIEQDCEVGKRWVVVAGMLLEHSRQSVSLCDAFVHPNLQRHSLGRFMLRHLCDSLHSEQKTIYATVGEDATHAHLWLKACGFTAGRVLRDFSEGRDAYPFSLSVSEGNLQNASSTT